MSESNDILARAERLVRSILVDDFRQTVDDATVTRVAREVAKVIPAYKEEVETTENCVTKIAQTNRRDYITPEDVTEALESNDETQVRLDVLAVIGKQTDFGAEDSGLCAFIAWQGS